MQNTRHSTLFDSAKSAAGFTLLELSIVLVIIGLIIGGITVGKDLIRSAELNSVVSELHEYKTAVNAFKLKYSALPGDMSNATDYWGAADADPATCKTTSSTGTETCNGDDNKLIDAPTSSIERFRFFQHLANAGLLGGSFTGVGGSGGANHGVMGENLPKGPLSGSGWIAASSTSTSGSATLFAVDYGNYMAFGKETTNQAPLDPLLTPIEAKQIDKKIDDGMPGQGSVIARYWDDACTVATANTEYTADYKLLDDTPQCALYFRKVW